MGINGAMDIDGEDSKNPPCFTFITLFPHIIEGYFQTSIMSRALQRGYYSVETVDLHRYRLGANLHCDDMPYGGGAGMVLRPEPLAAAIDSVKSESICTIVYPSAAGRPFGQPMLQQLRSHSHLLFICGRYEGIDQRIIDHYVDYEVSIGDYVLSSGELAATVIADALVRLIPGVLNPQSLLEESHRDGRVEYPHYTRPQLWRGIKVPDVLLSGDHAKIAAWRMKESIKKTIQNRPDMQ